MTSVGSSDFEEFCDDDTSLSRGSVDLQELIQLAQPKDVALPNIQHVLHLPNKDSSESHRACELPRGLSVGCQTEWSWLMYLSKLKAVETRGAHTNYPDKHKDIAIQTHSESISSGSDLSTTNTELKEGNNSPTAAEPVERPKKQSNARLDKSAKSDIDSLAALPSNENDNDEDNKSGSVHISVAYPSRADEYGIPVEKKELDDSDSWSSSESALNEAPVVEDELEEETAANEEITKLVDSLTDDNRHRKSDADAIILDGIDTCKFCGQMMKPFPSLEDQAVLLPEDLYCCSEFREHFAECLQETLLMSVAENNGDHGSDPVETAGSDQNKSDTLLQLMRRKGIYGVPSLVNTDYAVENMETINYQLSSRECLTSGWTVRTTSLDFDELEQETVDYNPHQFWKRPADVKLVMRTYENGSPFLLFFPDGTGNVFYPSGRLAVSIVSAESGQYAFYANEDTSNRPQLLAMFEPHGWSSVFYASGQIRLCISPRGGIELDRNGVKKHKWSWTNQLRHVHAPPLYPLAVAISNELSLQIKSQHDMMLTFSASTRSCRFNVGVNKRLKSVSSFEQSDVYDDNETYRKGVVDRFGRFVNKVASELRLPTSVRLPALSPAVRKTTSSQQSTRSRQQKSIAALQQQPKAVNRKSRTVVVQ